TGKPEGPHLLCRGWHLAKPGTASHGTEQIPPARAAPLLDDTPTGFRRCRSCLRTFILIAKDVREVSRSRSDTLPFGALVLDRLLAKGKATDVVSSVYGVREGLLYSKLPRRKMQSD